MCVICERKAKHLRLKNTGKVRYWARRFAQPFGMFPCFSRDFGIAVEAEFSRILRRRTFRRTAYRGGPRTEK